MCACTRLCECSVYVRECEYVSVSARVRARACMRVCVYVYNQVQKIFLAFNSAVRRRSNISQLIARCVRQNILWVHFLLKCYQTKGWPYY